jgi:hypothetical protein
MAPNEAKKHIFLEGYSENKLYQYPGPKPRSKDPKNQNRTIHGEKLHFQLRAIKDHFNLPLEIELPLGIVRDNVIYVEFVSEWGYELKFESLEQDNNEPLFQILNIKEEPRVVDNKNEYRYHVTLMMTEGGVSKFIKKVKEYLNDNIFRKDKLTGLKTDTGKAKHTALFNNIQNIQIATLKSFWTDYPEFPFPIENDSVWWEVWFRRSPNELDQINDIIKNLQIVGVEIGLSELVFAEHRVRLVRGTGLQLSQSLLLLDNLAELRKPQETADFITHKDENYIEKKEWLDDLIARTDAKIDDNSVLICLLDSGVNNQHPLILPFLPDDRLYSFKPHDWGSFDSWPKGGHGTGIAGLALYGDLVNALDSPHRIKILHGIESYKIIQTNTEIDPNLYGAITIEASSAPIIDRPDSPRVFCMTVTSKQFVFKGRPSSWSATIDKIAFGSDLTQQLFILSGGNVEIGHPNEYPSKNYLESIHDPGQSYNAITVGSYTRKDRIDTETRFTHLAPHGSMAPSNSTSTLWDSQWPIKPDIVMEGGNSSTNGIITLDHPSLKLLTTDKDFHNDVFLPFGDTSGAAALASKMAAELKTAYPKFWAETIRGLMVHSAEWTSAMLEGRKIKDLKKEIDRINLLRTVGYGVPILEKALNSAKNSLTLIAERLIQPYKNEGSLKYNEYHLFKMPWPVEILQGRLFDQDVTLKVTLSYYIEPNPGNKRYANNFQYHSHSLDFAVIKPNEPIEVFERRISGASDLPDEEKDGTGEEWFIGRVRSRGSVKKDFITMSGADMATRNIIAIYPKNGWYKTRKKLAKANTIVRYSMILTIETPQTEVDIYEAVSFKIKNDIKIKV